MSNLDDAVSVAPLQAGEEDELDAFLALHASSSMYLRAELRRDAAAAAFAIGRRHGVIITAAAQPASGMVVLQAPIAAGMVAAAVLRRSQRRLAGFFGTVAHTQAVCRELGLDGIAFHKNTQEDLFALTLSALRMPAKPAHETLACRVATSADAELLVAWRYAFRQHTLNEAAGEQLDRTSRADIDALLPAGSLFILESQQPLACCSFNARLPDCVQIGNVWTPPEYRGRGYARTVVAGALALARQQEVRSAVLATGRDNLAAQAAYRSIGFQVIGDYASIMIPTDVALPSF
jgi:ribosomal protein S18 acetylase RimI-like enzyme